MTIFDRIDFINICKFHFRKRDFSLFVAHPNDLVVINLEVIRKREAMINWNQLSNFFGSFFVWGKFFHHQDIGLVPITVQYPEVQYANFMNLTDFKLMRAKITNHISVLNKLLKRTMFSSGFVQVTFLLWNYRSLAQLFEVKTGMVELGVGSGRYSVEMFGCIKEIGSYFSCGTLPWQDAFSHAWGPNLSSVSSWIVGGIWFFVVGFVYCHFLSIILQKVGSRSAFRCEFRFSPAI